MARGTEIYGFVYDEDNLDKIGRRGISPEQLDTVLVNDHRIDRNRRGRRASHLVIGLDDNSRCIAIPVERTATAGMWRPVTAWYCKPAEVARLRQLRLRE